MRKCFFFLLWIFIFQSALADGPIYLPVLVKGNFMAIDPILRITNGTDVIDLLGNESGWELEDPYWNPQIAQYKSGGSYVNSGLAEGQRLVHKEYDNVVETIPLSAHGIDQNRSIQTVRRLLQMAKQASDYWTKSYEYDDVWIEARPACNDCLTGYARVIKMAIPEVTNPFGQPFFSSFNDAVMNGITLTIEREPLWRGLPPGEILGPMYNLLKNPDFELWNFGVADSQPDSWSDLETLQITGQNSREATVPNSGQYALKVRVSGSTAAGKAKGVTQIAESTKNNTEYTVVAWVRSDGVSNGVGRILVTYSSQLEVYRSSDRHGWTLYTGKFTTGTNDVVSINLEILTTAANTDGTIYVDSLMLLEGDFEEAAAQGTLPYMTSSHIVNHWDQPGGAKVEAGDLNFVDVWNVPGDEDALVRLEVQNNTTPAEPSAVVENFAKIVVGQRRTGNIFKFDNYHDPTGITDTTASSDNRVNSPALSAVWASITGNVISGSDNTRNNVGRYRVLARVWDTRTNANLQTRLSYYLGASGVGRKTLVQATAPISGNWCMVDLTPNVAMIQEQKQSVDFPAQLGYIVEMSRPAGTDVARLDYVLSVPTDGGYLKATLAPALTQNNIMVVDNTASLQISGTYRRAGWSRLITDSTMAWFADIREFNGILYAVGSTGVAGTTKIFKQTGSTWTTVLSWPSGGSFALEEFAGKLHVALYDAAGTLGGGYVYQTSDGVSWSSATQIAGYPLLRRMKAFSGRLFIAGTTIAAGNPGVIYAWNGSTLSLSATLAADESVSSFAVYGGSLYAGTTGPGVAAGLWQYSVAINSWTKILSFAGMDGINAMAEFQGKLYLGFLGDHGIWFYDGSATTQVYDPSTDATVFSMTGLIEYNGKVYAGAINGAATLGTILSSEDGVTWAKVYDPTLAVSAIQSFNQINGLLYLAGTSAAIGAVFVLTDSDIVYTVADFQGGAFTAPPRRFNDPRRHRWVFSWDRENYVNNADDKALIGLGYVPRYLTLRGAN